MATLFRLMFLAACVLGNTSIYSSEPKTRETEYPNLRFFNVAVLGETTDKPVVLLQRRLSGDLDPVTVMVDIDNGKLYAATVRYPKKLSFADARRSLNSIYAKHERKEFADDPKMGLWRNEEEKFAIQLTEEDEYLVVIYIKVSLVTDEVFYKGFSDALRKLDKEKSSHEKIRGRRADTLVLNKLYLRRVPGTTVDLPCSAE